MSQKKKKRIYLWGGILFGVGLLSVWGWQAKQTEKWQAISMQALLINISIAEDNYYEKHQTYTEDWNELLAYVNLLPILHTETVAVPEKKESYVFAFGAGKARQGNGYKVSLRLDADKQQGTIVAQRIGSRWYRYELQRPFPVGESRCENIRHSSGLCRQFISSTEQLEVRNLIPVPAGSSSTKSMQNKITS